MTGLNTLPSTRDQARHGLLLLGVPATPSLLVEVHTALFDGDLSIRSLAALIREEERALADAAPTGADHSPAADPGSLSRAASAPVSAPVSSPVSAPVSSPVSSPDCAPVSSPVSVCPGLNLDLTPARAAVTLAAWPLAQRICTPATSRADTLTAVIRVIEFAAARPGALPSRLLHTLSTLIPGGPESLDVLNPAALAEAAHLALTAPALTDAVQAESAARAEAAERAATLPERHQLFGVPTVPHQRGGA